eukprot:520541-Pyramimonas_sp.AAC.1
MRHCAKPTPAIRDVRSANKVAYWAAFLAALAELHRPASAADVYRMVDAHLALCARCLRDFGVEPPSPDAAVSLAERAAQ